MTGKEMVAKIAEEEAWDKEIAIGFLVKDETKVREGYINVSDWSDWKTLHLHCLEE